MKKSYLLAGLLLFVTLLSGCKKDKELDEPSVDPGLKGEMEELAPSKQKTRLQDIGIEFVNAINASTHENLADVVAYMEEELGGLYVDEDYEAKLEALYTETGGDDDYAPARKANPVEAIEALMALSLDAAQTGAQLATRADDIYMLTLKAGLKDLYGGFTPDMKNEEWKYDSSITDRLEVQFTDDHKQTWIATLKGSKETTRVHLTAEDMYKWKYDSYDWWSGETYTLEGVDHEKYDISIDVPKLITLVVKCGKQEVINLTVNSNLAFDADVYSGSISNESYDESGWSNEYKSELDLKVDYKTLNLDAALNVNGYAESLVTEATKTYIKASAEVKIDDKSMLKADAVVNGDIEAFIEQIEKANTYTDSYSSNEDYEEEYFDFDAKCFKDFSMVLDIMGKAQIYAKCDDGKKLYEAIYMTEEEYEEKYADYKEEKAFELYVDEINDAYSVTIHYDNTSTVQANIECEAHIEKYEDYYEEYTDYDVRPVLVFAVDDSRYAFEDYFTESGFSRLIDAVEKLAQDFEKMFENAYN